MTNLIRINTCRKTPAGNCRSSGGKLAPFEGGDRREGGGFGGTAHQVAAAANWLDIEWPAVVPVLVLDGRAAAIDACAVAGRLECATNNRLLNLLRCRKLKSNNLVRARPAPVGAHVTTVRQVAFDADAALLVSEGLCHGSGLLLQLPQCRGQLFDSPDTRVRDLAPSDAGNGEVVHPAELGELFPLA